MKDIVIVWKTGKMVIHPNGLFPCSLERFKKLLKIIKLDSEHQDDILQSMSSFFESRINELDEEISESSINYLSLVQDHADLRRKVESHKEPSGVYIEESKINVLKDKMRKTKKDIDECIKSVKKCNVNKKKFQKYLEIMNKKG